MNLSLLKEFFTNAISIQAHLESKHPIFQKVPAYSLFRLISPQAQPQLDSNIIKNFIKSFNWNLTQPSSNDVSENSNHRLVDFKKSSNPEEVLDHGCEVFIKHWGTNDSISFDEFALFAKGQHELPDSKNRQVPFAIKKQFFQTLLQEIQNLMQFEAYKKAIYHEYKNMTDLFETLTPSNVLTKQNLHRLFQMYGERKTDKEIDQIGKRVKLPCSFDDFLNIFKPNGSQKTKQFKVYYSSKRSKKRDDSMEKCFTTPRKPKANIGQSSTKVTKNQAFTDIKRSKLSVSEFNPETSEGDQWKIIARILELEEQFNEKKTELIHDQQFDLELVYERHGKKFEHLLNERYGACNFSAFVRFIIPQTYEHRYLAFIRYLKSNKLPERINQGIDELLEKFALKENEIKQMWGQTDKELTFRSLCLPREQHISVNKLNQFFTYRQIDIICDRMDPHRKGYIEMPNFQ